eukprot:2766505-Ditylum_brightwellii.AAC.1
MKQTSRKRKENTLLRNPPPQKTCISCFRSHLRVPSRPQCNLLLVTMRHMVQLYCTIFFVNTPAQQSQS